MKKLIALLPVLFCFGLIRAQDIQKSVLATSGNVLSKGDMVVRSTLGEAFIGRKTVGNVQMVSGFHAEAKQDNVSVPGPFLSTFTVHAFPNPFNSEIRVEIPDRKLLDYMTLYSSDGRHIRTVADGEVMPTEDLSPGFYVLNVALTDRSNHKIPIVKQ